MSLSLSSEIYIISGSILYLCSISGYLYYIWIVYYIFIVYLDPILLISKHLWPKSWPIQRISCQIAGVSQTKVQEVYQSVQIYPCEGPEGQAATLRPYVIDAPFNLIGRDLLKQWKTQIYSPHFS